MLNPEFTQKARQLSRSFAAIGATAALAAGCGSGHHKDKAAQAHSGGQSTKSAEVHKKEASEQHHSILEFKSKSLKAAKLVVADIVKGGQPAYHKTNIGVFPGQWTKTEAYANYKKEGTDKGSIYVDAISMPEGKAANFFNETGITLQVTGKAAQTMDAELTAGQLTDQDYENALDGEVSVKQTYVNDNSTGIGKTMWIDGAKLQYTSQGIDLSAKDLLVVESHTASEQVVGDFLDELDHTSQHLRQSSI